MNSIINSLLRRSRRSSRRLSAATCETLELRQLLTVPDPVATVPAHVEQFDLFTDETLTTPGLVGSFVIAACAMRRLRWIGETFTTSWELA